MFILFTGRFPKRLMACALALLTAFTLAACAKKPEPDAQQADLPAWEAGELSYARARELYNEGEYGEAERECLALLLQTPDDADTLRQLADIERDLGNSAQLEAVLDRLFASGAAEENLPYLEYYESVDAGEVTWHDPVVEQKVREYLGMPDGSPIYRSDLENIVDITIYADEWHFFTAETEQRKRTADYAGAQIAGLGGITSLRDFANFKNLEYLGVFYNSVSTIDPRLCRLQKLTGLCLGDNYITNVSALAGMPGLEELDVSYNPISDLSPLAGLSRLQSLSVSGCPARDLAPLGALGTLTGLRCSECCLSDASFAAPLTALEQLDLGGNDITDLSPLAGLTALTVLKLDGNKSLSDLSPLSGCTALEALWLRDTAADGYTAGLSLVNAETFANGRSY